jgi:hypothetical protein
MFLVSLIPVTRAPLTTLTCHRDRNNYREHSVFLRRRFPPSSQNVNALFRASDFDGRCCEGRSCSVYTDSCGNNGILSPLKYTLQSVFGEEVEKLSSHTKSVISGS